MSTNEPQNLAHYLYNDDTVRPSSERRVNDDTVRPSSEGHVNIDIDGSKARIILYLCIATFAIYAYSRL